MRLLQCNVQRINTSLPLLQQTAYRLQLDIILLQEIWHPESDNSLGFRNYPHSFTKVRQNAQGGGVAIIQSHRVPVLEIHICAEILDLF